MYKRQADPVLTFLLLLLDLAIILFIIGYLFIPDQMPHSIIIDFFIHGIQKGMR